MDSHDHGMCLKGRRLPDCHTEEKPNLPNCGHVTASITSLTACSDITKSFFEEQAFWEVRETKGKTKGLMLLKKKKRDFSMFFKNEKNKHV